MKSKLMTTCFVVLLLAGSAWATPTVHFFQSVLPGTGVVSYDGSLGGSLVGTGIAVDTIQGEGTPANATDVSPFAAPLACTSCVMSFTTGAYSAVDSSSSTYAFNGGGTFTITGSVAALGLSNTVLVQGHFDLGAPTYVINGSGGLLKVVAATVLDNKAQALADYYGLGVYGGLTGPTMWVANLALQADTTPRVLPPNAFTSTNNIKEVSLTNSPVPEPASLLLLGSGLMGFAGFLRRRIG